MSKILIVKSRNIVLHPRMISAEAKAVYVMKHKVPFPKDQYELAVARHHEGLVDTAEEMGQRGFLTAEHHHLCDNDHDFVAGCTTPLAIEYIDQAYCIDIVGNREVLIDKTGTTWTYIGYQPKQNVTSPLMTMAEAKNMSEVGLACVVAHSSHVITRMNALAVLAGMPEDASDAAKYAELEQVDKDMAGTNMHLQLHHVYGRASQKRAREEA